MRWLIFESRGELLGFLGIPSNGKPHSIDVISRFLADFRPSDSLKAGEILPSVRSQSVARLRNESAGTRLASAIGQTSLVITLLGDGVVLSRTLGQLAG